MISLQEVKGMWKSFKVDKRSIQSPEASESVWWPGGGTWLECSYREGKVSRGQGERMGKTIKHLLNCHPFNLIPKTYRCPVTSTAREWYKQTCVDVRKAKRDGKPLKKLQYEGRWVVAISWSDGEEVKGEVETVWGILNLWDSRITLMWEKPSLEWLHLVMHSDPSCDPSYNPSLGRLWNDTKEFEPNLDSVATSGKPRPLYRKTFPHNENESRAGWCMTLIPALWR